ncbi:hypothetical protein D3C76_1552650 [compost metagenome]
MQQGFAHRRQRGDHGGAGTHGFGTDDIADILAFKNDLLQLARLGGDELHIQVGSDLDQQLFIGQVDTVVAGGKGQQAV